MPLLELLEASPLIGLVVCSRLAVSLACHPQGHPTSPDNDLKDFSLPPLQRASHKSL